MELLINSSSFHFAVMGVWGYKYFIRLNITQIYLPKDRAGNGYITARL